ncbi:MAG: hypothetical protein UY28_C0038G0018, partial [Candidatus Amesbacteria bacterium GW2011_GWB1_48_13]
WTGKVFRAAEKGSQPKAQRIEVGQKQGTHKIFQCQETEKIISQDVSIYRWVE